MLCVPKLLAAIVGKVSLPWQSYREGQVEPVALGPEASRVLITPNAAWTRGPHKVNKKYFPTANF